jgi:hypothetical protein
VKYFICYSFRPTPYREEIRLHNTVIDVHPFEWIKGKANHTLVNYNKIYDWEVELWAETEISVS